MAGDARGSSHCRKTRVGAAPGAHASRLVAIDGLIASASNFPVFESVGGTQTALACQCFRILGPRREFSILRKTTTSGPSDGTEDRPTKQDHSQRECPRDPLLEGREQDEGEEPPPKDRQECQAYLS